jgi:hypothetical protein
MTTITLSQHQIQKINGHFFEVVHALPTCIRFLLTYLNTYFCFHMSTIIRKPELINLNILRARPSLYNNRSVNSFLRLHILANNLNILRARFSLYNNRFANIALPLHILVGGICT